MYLNEKKELVFGDPEDTRHAIGIQQSRKAAYKELAEKIDSGEIRAVGAHATRLSHLPSQLRQEAPKASTALTGRSVNSLRAQLLAETSQEDLWTEFEATKRESASVRVTNEARQYNRNSDPDGRLFLRDVARSTLSHDTEARSRLDRHMQEERVIRPELQERAAGDVGTSGFSALTVPAYVVNEALPRMGAYRPLADACNRLPLPPTGVNLHLGVVNANATVTNQTELAESSATSGGTTDTTVPVNTASGELLVSKQAVDRSAIPPMAMLDLLAAYNTNLDSTLITGTNGLQAVANSNAFTGTTAPLFMTAVMQAVSQCTAAFKSGQRGKCDLVLLHDRRWAYLASQMSTSFPLTTSDVPEVTAVGPTVGRLPSGHKVLCDSSIPTNVVATQDLVFAVNSNELFLWELPDQPLFIKAEQSVNAGKLSTLLVVYSYYAYYFQRFANAVQMLTGAGLAANAGF